MLGLKIAKQIKNKSQWKGLPLAFMISQIRQKYEKQNEAGATAELLI